MQPSTYTDIISPASEKELEPMLRRSLELGFTPLIGVQPSKLTTFSKLLETILSNSNVGLGVLLSGKKEQKLISKYKQTMPVVVQTHDNVRELSEKHSGLFIYGMESHTRRDHMHFRFSGLNHILVDLAKKKHHTFVFSLSNYLAGSSQTKSILLGRVKQNITLCEKKKVPYLCATFGKNQYDIKDWKSLLSLLKKEGPLISAKNL